MSKPEMKLDHYQKIAMQTAVYPHEVRAITDNLEHNGTARDLATMLLRLSYVGLGLAGEAGEYANKIKKLIRDTEGHLNDETREALALELGGVLWYLAANAKELGYSLSHIAQMNELQLRHRHKKGTIHGSGDHR